jgi:hypothetical protein
VQCLDAPTNGDAYAYRDTYSDGDITPNRDVYNNRNANGDLYTQHDANSDLYANHYAHPKCDAHRIDYASASGAI